MQNNHVPPAIDRSPVASNRAALRTLAVAEAARRGRFRWAEFGVRGGKSARLLLELLPPGRGELHLFDSFKGLPEEWDLGGGDVAVKGRFACDVPTFSDPRVTIHEGLFEDTILPFLDSHKGWGLDFAHLDCDLYRSTVTVLEGLRSLFSRGSVLLFDDTHGYPNWREGQWRAFQEFIGDLDHTWLGHTVGMKGRKWVNGQAAVRLDEDW